MFGGQWAANDREGFFWTFWGRSEVVLSLWRRWILTKILGVEISGEPISRSQKIFKDGIIHIRVVWNMCIHSIKVVLTGHSPTNSKLLTSSAPSQLGAGRLLFRSSCKLDANRCMMKIIRKNVVTVHLSTYWIYPILKSPWGLKN